jgi:hypothetical protein
MSLRFARWRRQSANLLSLLLALLALLGGWAAPAQAAMDPPAAPTPVSAVAAQSFPYLCDGEPLIARYDNGAVDAPGIPNSVPLARPSPGGTALASGSADPTTITVPGAFVVLRWGELSLQLPRTNVAGAPSYSDGRWWWSLEDPQQPRFLERRGSVRTHVCVKRP